MATWNSRGLRGSGLESLINMTIEKYELAGLAMIQKVPTPITPIKIDDSTRQITLAYFDKKSTVDYIGVVQGVPICFDAKECAADTYSLANIHEHQIDFMRKFEKQKGIAFIILMYDMIIIGAGPAGISAVVYGKSRGKKVLVLEKLMSFIASYED